MKNGNMRQQFVSGLLVTLSLTSLALLRLQDWVLTAVGSKHALDLNGMDSRMGGWIYYSWPDMVQVALLLTLALITIIALLTLRSSTGQKPSGGVSDDEATVTHRPATNLYGNPVSAGLN